MGRFFLFRPVIQCSAHLFSEKINRNTIKTLCCVLSHTHMVVLMLQQQKLLLLLR